jgi:hypothetical protein
MTRWRVTAKISKLNPRKRICTDSYWDKKSMAQRYADETNKNYPGANARVVKDSERVRRMIP